MKLVFLGASVSTVEALLVREHFAHDSDVKIVHAEEISDISAFTNIDVYGMGLIPAVLNNFPLQPLEELFKQTQQFATVSRFIIGITSCPTGVAHTYMAAEGLEAGAEKLGYQIKIETQGSVGADNVLTAEEIARADVVIIASDTNVDLARFKGKRLFKSRTKAAINDGAELITKALNEASIYADNTVTGIGIATAQQEDKQSTAFARAYKHLMTGVSHMLPFVVAGGLLIALGFALGSFQFGEQGIHVYKDEFKGTLAATLFWIGKDAFTLFVPILAGFIGFSIGGRPALAPAMIGGLIANNTGAGFLGAILAGYAGGYFVDWVNRLIKLPKSLDALKPTLILPLIGSAAVGLLMYFVIAEPVAKILNGLTTWLGAMQAEKSHGAFFVGALLGGMMAVDMGGPINKAAYATSVALVGTEVYAPMAATMVGGMTPPLAIFLATLLFKNEFTTEEREAGKAAGVLGLSFITEGAIPFAAKDPLRVIPALILGSAVAGALSMALGCELKAPHGGIFVLFIPNAINGLVSYAIALAVGTIVSTFALGFLKKTI